MKTNIIFLVLFCFGLNGNAQILKKIKKATGRAVENVIIKKTEDKAANETGKVMDTVLNPNLNKKSQGSGEDFPMDKETEEKESSPVQLWTTYDFVPGSEIVFTDDLNSEKVGEFPSRWDLVSGNAENVLINGEKAIQLNNKSIVTPLINAENYLSDVFTIEFDAYFNAPYTSWHEYFVRFYPGAHRYLNLGNGNMIYPLKIRQDGASLSIKKSNTKRDFTNYEGNGRSDFSGWKHIAISYNKRALKVYIDEERVLNIPNIHLQPELVSIEGDSQKDFLKAIKNIRIARGGLELYDKVMEEGKFVTHGIHFDVNKASIKPESGGVLKEIFQLMEQHPDLSFRIVGHTDSDGEAEYNLELSRKRAKEVRETLIKMGVESKRLIAEGLGEANPIAGNETAEGKSKNRRVEFIKL